MERVPVGVSTFGEKPDLVGPEHLESLLRHALDIVPTYDVPKTPVFLLATAGVRLLPDQQRSALLAQICSYIQSTTQFLLPDCQLHVQVIPGETEALYGWVAANYLLGAFDEPHLHDHGHGHHTYGFLDMGGASAQIAFMPNATEAGRHANDLKLLRMRTLDRSMTEYKVFATTWLGFGVHEARRRYVQALLDSSATADVHELPDPCLPVGLTTTQHGHVLPHLSQASDGHRTVLRGTGRFDECLRQTHPLLDMSAPCSDPPCLLNGAHVPAIDFDVNHFVGVSEYWHTTHEVFEMGHTDKSYDFNTYQTRVKEFCSREWKTITEGVKNDQWGKKVDKHTAVGVCFKAAWLINVLHEGIGIPRVGLENIKTGSHNGTKEFLEHAKQKGYLDPFQAVHKVRDVEISWTLGKMVLYASSQIPSNPGTLPVGFGPNVPGIPPDFQYASVSVARTATNNATINVDRQHGPSWSETILDSDSPRRIPGLVLFLLIVCVVMFVWCRRTRIMRRFYGVMGRPGNPKKRKAFGGPLFGGGNAVAPYDRVLEEGDPGIEFDLNSVDSDPEGSDCSDVHQLGRSSGWATPQLNVESHPSSTTAYFEHKSLSHGVGLGLGLGSGPTGYLLGNAMNRSGLVVRSDSRDRLATSVGAGFGLGPSASGDGGSSHHSSGRRSRTDSPVRLKTPLMIPIPDDYD